MFPRYWPRTRNCRCLRQIPNALQPGAFRPPLTCCRFRPRLAEGRNLHGQSFLTVPFQLTIVEPTKSTMNPKPPQSKMCDGVFPKLDLTTQPLSTAKDACRIASAQIALGSVRDWGQSDFRHFGTVHVLTSQHAKSPRSLNRSSLNK